MNKKQLRKKARDIFHESQINNKSIIKSFYDAIDFILEHTK